LYCLRMCSSLRNKYSLNYHFRV